MSWYPFNPTLGQKMQSNVAGVNVDMSFIAHLRWAATEAVAADANAVHAAIAASADTVVVETTDFVAPPCVRNISATVAATDVQNIKAVQVIVEGTNVAGDTITETLPAFTVNTAGTVVGAKAFATVTKVTVPAMDGVAVTVTIGFGAILGIPYKLSHNTLLAAYLNNVIEAQAATVTVSATAVESNTIALNSALDGHVVDVYVIV